MRGLNQRLIVRTIKESFFIEKIVIHTFAAAFFHSFILPCESPPYLSRIAKLMENELIKMTKVLNEIETRAVRKVILELEKQKNKT